MTRLAAILALLTVAALAALAWVLRQGLPWDDDRISLPNIDPADEAGW